MTENSVYTWKPCLNLFPAKFSKELEALESEVYVDEGIVKNWDEGQIDPEQASRFTKYMQSSHITAANGLARKINLKERFGVNSLLDVGAGSGCFR